MRYAVTFALVAGLLSGGVSFVAGQRSATVAAERDAHKAAAERLNASLIELHATTEAAMAAAAEEREHCEWNRRAHAPSIGRRRSGAPGRTSP